MLISHEQNIKPNKLIIMQNNQFSLTTNFLPTLPLPSIPLLNLKPPQISSHSYTLYYQKKHLMLINGQEQFDSGLVEVNIKLKNRFESSQKDSLQQQQNKANQQNKLINITLLTKCPRCLNWLQKSQINLHMTFHAAIILQNLFLGDKFSSQSKKQLFQRLNVTHIVNAATQLNNYFQNDGIVYFKLDLLDSMSEDVIQPCLEAAQFIKTAIENGGKVFVHCAMGKSRSVAAILIYLIKYHAMSLKQSLHLVKQKRSIIKPNPSYLNQLEKFYQSFCSLKK